jgi:glucose-6-phosphate 1-dehydrogenase
MAWQFIDAIEDVWKNSSSSSPIRFYESGSWGPYEADEMLAQDGRSWRLL